jgi:hypothetical protein
LGTGLGLAVTNQVAVLMSGAEEEQEKEVLTLRYRFNMRPELRVTRTPGIGEVLHGMEASDYGFWAATTISPAFMGYRVQGNR